jgi:hypothetical protein
VAWAPARSAAQIKTCPASGRVIHGRTGRVQRFNSPLRSAVGALRKSPELKNWGESVEDDPKQSFGLGWIVHCS